MQAKGIYVLKLSMCSGQLFCKYLNKLLLDEQTVFLCLENHKYYIREQNIASCRSSQ